MRGVGQQMTVGERVAWYRMRRGMSQEILAGLVGRTVDWLSKAENNRIELDRLSVISALAEELDVTLGDLLGEPSVLDWTPDSGQRTVPALREALLDYRQLSPLLSITPPAEPIDLTELRRIVNDVWGAYQDSRYGFVVHRLPALVKEAQNATRAYEGEQRIIAHELLALTYQATAVLLTKLGEADLAWIAAERGFQSAQATDNPLIVGSLFRSLIHALLSTGRFQEASGLTTDAAGYLQGGLGHASPAYLSMYGTLFLAGAVAAARAEDRATVRQFLGEADQAAARLGQDANHLWTAFGPTNVAIHRVTTAMDLGDVQVAIDLGPSLDTSGLPIERQVRHSMETARALSAWNRTDEALSVLLDAEQLAPEQVRHHSMSRMLVQAWMRRARRKPDYRLTELAKRVRVSK